MREEMISRKLEFDLIVTSLSDIRTKGLGKDETSKMAEEEGEMPPETTDALPALNPHAKPYVPASRSGTPSGPQVVVHPPSASTPKPEDEFTKEEDIEMGELAETETEPADVHRLSPKKVRRTSSKEELEEGEERSDSEFGSELTELGETEDA